jgi:hypothetical protein
MAVAMMIRNELEPILTDWSIPGRRIVLRDADSSRTVRPGLRLGGAANAYRLPKASVTLSSPVS